MSNNLKEHFPMIREKDEVLSEIRASKKLLKLFESWRKEQQEEFLMLCTGVRGIKLVYDGFFKEIMNPEYAPERMNDFLSQLLKRTVKVLSVLPTESVRLADETSLVMMDIVVELEDGSIANVEMQKIGYLFPGQRSACYSADLLLRQYKRMRDNRQKKFSYRDIKNVYTIVLFENSPSEFCKYPDIYRHYFEQKSDTGLEMELLQKYVFIPLDIFRKKLHNKGIQSKFDAWLAVFAEDKPEIIEEVIVKYPEFKRLYEEAYVICRNMERVMEMFSEELHELDKNTVQYMIDEMQDTIDTQKDTIDGQKRLIEKSIADMIQMMRQLGIPEEDIKKKMQEQYQLYDEEIQKYL